MKCQTKNDDSGWSCPSGISSRAINSRNESKGYVEYQYSINSLLPVWNEAPFWRGENHSLRASRRRMSCLKKMSLLVTFWSEWLSVLTKKASSAFEKLNIFSNQLKMSSFLPLGLAATPDLSFQLFNSFSIKVSHSHDKLSAKQHKPRNVKHTWEWAR